MGPGGVHLLQVADALSRQDGSEGLFRQLARGDLCYGRCCRHHGEEQTKWRTLKHGGQCRLEVSPETVVLVTRGRLVFTSGDIRVMNLEKKPLVLLSR